MAAANTGYIVPAGDIRYGEGHLSESYYAEGAITPGYLVMQGTAVNQVVVCTAGTKNVLGVADVNSDALAEDLAPISHAYAAGDECVVIQTGKVVVVADTAGIVAGEKVMVGISTSGMVDVYTDTAVGAAFNQANLELVKDELGLLVGHGLTTAASGVKALILLDL